MISHLQEAIPAPKGPKGSAHREGDKQFGDKATGISGQNPLEQLSQLALGTATSAAVPSLCSHTKYTQGHKVSSVFCAKPCMKPL